MNTEVWGPAAWLFLHSVALGYPGPSAREAYKRFFVSLGDVLPCPHCQNHYKTHLDLQELEKALNSKQSLFEWSVDIHNTVNESLGKRRFTYLQALKSLDAKYAPQRSWMRIVLGLSGTILLLFIALVVYVSCQKNDIMTG